MSIHYLLDTHFGDYDRDAPTPEEARGHIATLLEEARLADRHGFDGVLVPDRHNRTETMAPAPLALLSALTQVTDRCILGTFSLVLTLYPPMLVAEEMALLDLLSGGRTLFSVSMGYHPAYFAQVGIDPVQRVSRFEESVDILHQAWTGDTFSFHGKRFDLDDVRCTPTPLQPGGPPLWMGGESEQMITRAATRGDAWATGQAPVEIDPWLRRVESYRTQAEAAGKPGEVVIMRDGFVAGTYEEAARIAGAAAVAEQMFLFRNNSTRRKRFPPPFETEQDFTVENMRPHLVLGSPDDCIEQLQRCHDELDADHVVMRFRFPLGPSAAAVGEAIQQFGEEVIPHVKPRTPRV
jgi:alkanesulfonate monooxygenase SsuD/methylene tetrahydromethanopterin reductase-like flavin-dependent oxidoreductase (luciferase family)